MTRRLLWHWAPAALGALCTTIWALASFPLGILGSGSELWQESWFLALRDSTEIQVFAGFANFFATLGVLVAWLLLVKMSMRRKITTRYVLCTGAAWAFPLLFAIPYTSSDIYSYIGLGKLLQTGADPYSTTVSAVLDWESLGISPTWSETTTPYGPFALALNWLVIVALPASAYIFAVLSFRILAIAAIAITAYFLVRISAMKHGRASLALLIVIVNPLTLASGILAVHNDAILVMLGAIAIHASLSKHKSGSFIATLVSVGIKPTTVLLAPALVGMSLPAETRWKSRLSRLVLFAVLLGIGLWIGVLSIGGQLVDWIHSLIATPQLAVPNWYVPVQLLLGEHLRGNFIAGGTPTWAAITASVIAIVGVVTAVFVAVTALRHRDPLGRAALGYGILLATSTVMWPWYFLWLLMLLGARIATNAHARGGSTAILLVVGITVFFTLQSFVPGGYDASLLKPPYETILSVTPKILGIVFCLTLFAIWFFRWRKRRRRITTSRFSGTTRTTLPTRPQSNPKRESDPYPRQIQ